MEADTTRLVRVFHESDAAELIVHAKRGRHTPLGAAPGAAGGRIGVEHSLAPEWRAFVYLTLSVALDEVGIAGPLRWWIGRYPAGGRHPRHLDRGADEGTCRREWSISVGLSRPDTYSGGDLVLYDVDNGPETERLRLRPGEGIVFPSTCWHEVTPVERGERWTLAGWVSAIPS